MLVVNHFRFVGVVYEDAIYKQRNDGLKITKFTLLVKNNVNKPKENTYLPIYVKGNGAVEAANICRRGNRVAVNGRVETINKFDPKTGYIHAFAMFIAEDKIYLISKQKKNHLAKNKAMIISDWFCPDKE